ncbi:hypothetical protein RGR602_CH00110 [Rhizobium gallicum bv. gallicum R602sp]|uniref:Uncharacterized protein n=1 Tax=Rhizobium gallicum bv. gallicum R602sp TaxID=1041138 RepID=A0A0B4WY58_9HYPH|nr:hypothetical protein RGR602_CH00110 [Rhizobium gallicum bv. gallicum R602sp]
MEVVKSTLWKWLAASYGGVRQNSANSIMRQPLMIARNGGKPIGPSARIPAVLTLAEIVAFAASETGFRSFIPLKY